MNSAFAILLAVTLPGAGPVEAELALAGGQTVRGELIELTERQVVVKTATGELQHASAQVLELKPATAGAAVGATLAPILVTWVDGTTLPASAYQVTGGKATVTLVNHDGQSTTLVSPTEAIAYVGLQHELLSKHQVEWDAIVNQSPKSDLIVVAKREALDYVEGVLGDISDASVSFETDGETLAVKRARAAGLVYAHAADKSPAAVAVATLVSGHRVPLLRFALAAEVLEVITPSGLELHLPWASVSRLDYSRGKVIALGELRPEKTEWSPFLAPAELPEAVSAHYLPRVDLAFDGGPLTLDGHDYAKGIALRSRTEVVYRLPDKFRRFTAIAGIDDAVRPQGSVRLEIFGDDRVLLAATIDGRSAPLPINVDLSGVNRLKIVVDFGDDLDVGDQLDLCEARLEK